MKLSLKTVVKESLTNRWLKWLPMSLFKKYADLRPVQPLLGNGTQTDPYQIATVENLLWLSNNVVVWDKHFMQTTTIDCKLMREFAPIGRRVPFTGTYDGNGFGLTNFNRKMGVSEFIGLFHVLENAKVRNLVFINTRNNKNAPYGVLAYKALKGTEIENVHIRHV